MKALIGSIAAIVLGALLFTIFLPNSAIIYEDRFDELDIPTRCADVVAMVEAGDQSPYVLGMVDALQKDLARINTSRNERVKAINRVFRQSVAHLGEYVQAAWDGDGDAAAKSLALARAAYKEADDALNAYKRELHTPQEVG